MTLNPDDYRPGSHFESCPAATGAPLDPGERDGRIHGCQHFPDGAHRCKKARNHVSPTVGGEDYFIHECTDGNRWYSSTNHPLHGQPLNPDPSILLRE